MDTRETYNKIAKDWHRDHQADNWWVEGTDWFVNFLGEGSLVLDVGCAGGVKSRYLVNKGLKVLGIDFSENFIDIAKKYVPEAEFQVMDMRDLSALNKEFDGIFAQASLLHIPKKEISSVLESLVSKLRKGGLLYVAVKEVKDGYPEEQLVKEDDYGYEYERFFSYYSMDELKSYFKDLNLKITYENISKGKSRWLQIIGEKL